MSFQKSVKGGKLETPVVQVARVYRQPEVHDLGKLELVQGLVGIRKDFDPARSTKAPTSSRPGNRRER
jgi:hypothetical protein